MVAATTGVHNFSDALWGNYGNCRALILHLNNNKNSTMSTLRCGFWLQFTGGIGNSWFVLAIRIFAPYVVGISPPEIKQKLRRDWSTERNLRQMVDWFYSVQNHNIPYVTWCKSVIYLHNFRAAQRWGHMLLNLFIYFFKNLIRLQISTFCQHLCAGAWIVLITSQLFITVGIGNDAFSIIHNKIGRRTPSFSTLVFVTANKTSKM